MELTDISISYEMAKDHHKAGRLAEAEALYRAILGANPDHADALHMLGVAALQSGRANAALPVLQRAVGIEGERAAFHTTLGQAWLQLGQPEQALRSFLAATGLRADFAPAHFFAGIALRQLGRREEARVAFETAIKLAPDHVLAMFHLGSILQEQGERTGAIARYREALALAPDFVEVQLNLGICLASGGDVAAALPHLERAAALQPELVEAHGALGNAFLELGQIERAVGAYRKALQIDPRAAVVQFNLGNAFRAEGRLEAALMTYREALATDPRLAQAAINAGGVCDDLRRYAEAERYYRQALAIDPDAALAHAGLGLILRSKGALDDAISEAERGVALDPNSPHTHSALGLCLQTRGQFEEAASAFRRALALDPYFPTALVQLVNTQGARLTDDERGHIQQAFARPYLSRTERASLHFAAGALADRERRYDAAFEHYAQGNAIKAATRSYDPAEIARHVDALVTTFDRAFFEAHKDFGASSDRPIFVLGMPRSGTTLVEQILASHPMVHGSGELSATDLLVTGVAELPAAREARSEYPNAVRLVDRAGAEMLAGRYLEEIGKNAGDAARITDKMPGNFLRIGLIAHLLPRAHIIHCARDPFDTCLSCFFQDFQETMSFTNGLDRLGQYYRAYERLMAHWRSVLPRPMLEVSYEALVGDPEPWCRRILEYCNLPWEDRVLRFFATERAIQTASFWQARQPIYRSSVGRWKHYRKHLAPLFEALGRQPAPIPGADDSQ